jgi:ribose 5-phosphate isomerase B
VEKKKIAIAADHAGFKLKERLLKHLLKEGYEIKDFGCFSEESVDYPDFAHPLASSVENGAFEFGITICGIRSALCWNEKISYLARSHNDANICALPAKFISESEAFLIIKTFLTTGFDGGRHKRRIDKISVKLY